MENALSRGIALLNAGHYYKAHEALEDAWREAEGDVKLFRQALVQVAVAMHHHSTGNLNGARSVLARAMRNLTPFPGSFEGLDVADLRLQLTNCAKAIEQGVGGVVPRNVQLKRLE